MTPRFSIALVTGILSTALALLFICWRYHSDNPFANLGYQEFATPNPEHGFEYIEGYQGPQSFYWREIVTSKEYKLEVVHQLGETPKTKWGLLYGVTVERSLSFDLRKKESLYLVVHFAETPDEVVWGGEWTEGYQAYARAFVEVVKRRGIDVAPHGETFFLSRDIASWKVRLRHYWLEFLLVGCISSFSTVLLLRAKKKPNQSPQTRATSGPV